jgi:hypothetical protein
VTLNTQEHVCNFFHTQHPALISLSSGRPVERRAENRYTGIGLIAGISLHQPASACISLQSAGISLIQQIQDTNEPLLMSMQEGAVLHDEFTRHLVLFPKPFS